jgi:hypothetical protein
MAMHAIDTLKTMLQSIRGQTHLRLCASALSGVGSRTCSACASHNTIRLSKTKVTSPHRLHVATIIAQILPLAHSTTSQQANYMPVPCPLPVRTHPGLLIDQQKPAALLHCAQSTESHQGGVRLADSGSHMSRQSVSMAAISAPDLPGSDRVPTSHDL